MKCTVEDSCDRVMRGTEVRTGTVDLGDMNGEETEHLIQDRLKLYSNFRVAVLVILGALIIWGIIHLLRNCLSWGSLEINLEVLKLRLMQITSTWQVSAVCIASIIALVVLMGLRYWFELRMVREHRLSQKMKYDFISQKVDGLRDLLKGAPQKDGTHRYEIVISRKQDSSPTV